MYYEVLCFVEIVFNDDDIFFLNLCIISSLIILSEKC